MNLLFLIHTASTLCLVGLIWTIQLVHYPLFEQVGSDTYTAYQAAHQWRITLLVLPLMLAELVTAGLLVLNPPRDVRAVVAWLGLILVGVIWLSTFFLQMPQHATLGKGFDAQAHHLLVNSNWIRTIAWSLRGLIALWMIRGPNRAPT